MGITHWIDMERETVSKGGGSPSGEGGLLFAVETDRKRIGLEMLLRLAAAALAAFLTWYREGTLRPALLAVFLVFTAWPLVHLGDRMELRQNGIVYRGELYPVRAGTQVTWTGGRGFFLPTTRLDMGGERINVSFMKDAQKLFNRAYHNAIYS